MKKLSSLLFVLALTLGFAASSFAQSTKPTLETSFAPYIVGAITTAPGASNENYVVGIGLERDTTHFYFDGSGVYSTALVTANPATPHVGLFTVQGYYKIAGHLLAGVGATTVLNTGDFSTGAGFISAVKAAANPFVGTGLEFGRFRTIATYQIPMRGNGAIPEQIKFNVSNEFALTRHIRIGVPLTINSYQTGGPFLSLGGHRITVTQIGGELKLVL